MKAKQIAEVHKCQSVEIGDVVSYQSAGKKAKIKGYIKNCLLMSEILGEYLAFFWGVKTKLINVKVRQGRRKVNHYCLQLKNGKIIDATSSQFKDMPKIFIGNMPDFYIKIKVID